MGETPRDRLNSLQLKALAELAGDTRGRDLSSTITKIESALAVALFYKYGDERPLGIFGSLEPGTSPQEWDFIDPKAGSVDAAS